MRSSTVGHHDDHAAGAMCGAEDWLDIEVFGQTRKDGLKTLLELPGDIPSHNTFRRYFGAWERNHFAQAPFQWTQTLHEGRRRSTKQPLAS